MKNITRRGFLRLLGVLGMGAAVAVALPKLPDGQRNSRLQELAEVASKGKDVNEEFNKLVERMKSCAESFGELGRACDDFKGWEGSVWNELDNVYIGENAGKDCPYTVLIGTTGETIESLDNTEHLC